MRRSLLIAAAGLVSLWPHLVHAGEPACADLLPLPATGSVTPAGGLRPVTALDLVRLRDIGPVYASIPAVPILTISPDGARVAFQVRRADPESNRYCLGMVVVDLAKPEQATLVDAGGDYMPAANSEYGLAHVPVGYPAIITPLWSTDGQWVAYLRRDEGIVQIWRARADGTHSEKVTQSLTDVEAFAWSKDGASIVYSITPGVDVAEHSIKREGRSGYLFDDRFMPAGASAPYPRASLVSEVHAVRLADGQDRLALPEERGWLTSNKCGPENAVRAVCLGDQVAWIAPRDKSGSGGATTVVVRRDGKIDACELKVCAAARDLWWGADSATLYFLARDGWALDRLSVYAWRKGQLAPEPIYDTASALIGCQYTAEHLICAEEATDKPRRLISIDLATGQSAMIYDLNSEFAGIRLGPVTHLQWQNNVGIRTFGDLVLPPDHTPGQRHPLIVVGYDSHGFLRGGTGDEYPIQLLAAHGFAVLSYERPMDYGAVYGQGKSDDEVERLNRQDWADRRSVLSSIEAGIQLAIAGGAVDPDRIGLTGFSDGSSSARFALINGHVKYAAVALSQCCEDTTTLSLMNNRARGRRYSLGYSRITDHPRPFWSAYSVRLNAGKFNVPMLIQTSDDEFRYGLESVTALQERGQPVEMYVFPDEHHIKWQPAHRLAVYQRNIDWFDFWLRGVVDPDPSKVDQYKRWQALHAMPSHNMGAPHSG